MTAGGKHERRTAKVRVCNAQHQSDAPTRLRWRERRRHGRNGRNDGGDDGLSRPVHPKGAGRASEGPSLRPAQQHGFDSDEHRQGRPLCRRLLDRLTLPTTGVEILSATSGKVSGQCGCRHLLTSFIRGQVDRAIDRLSETLSIRPNDTTALARRAKANWKANKLGGCEKDVLKLLELDPTRRTAQPDLPSPRDIIYLIRRPQPSQTRRDSSSRSKWTRRMLSMTRNRKTCSRACSRELRILCRCGIHSYLLDLTLHTRRLSQSSLLMIPQYTSELATQKWMSVSTPGVLSLSRCVVWYTDSTVETRVVLRFRTCAWQWGSRGVVVVKRVFSGESEPVHNVVPRARDS